MRESASYVSSSSDTSITIPEAPGSADKAYTTGTKSETLTPDERAYGLIWEPGIGDLVLANGHAQVASSEIVGPNNDDGQSIFILSPSEVTLFRFKTRQPPSEILVHFIS